MGIFQKKRGRIKRKWEYKVGSGLIAGPMVYDIDKDGKKEIVFGTKDGRIILMDENSNVRWIYDIKEEVGEVESYFQDTETANSITSPPAIGDIDDDGQNEIIFGTESGFIYALNIKGEIIWKFKADDAVRSAILLKDIDDDGNLELVFGCMNGNLYVVNCRGQILWKHEAGSAIEGTPTIIPGTYRVVFGCHDGTIRCVKLQGDELWKHQTDGKVVAKPTISDLFGTGKHSIIIGSTDFNLYVLTEAGELVWTYPTEGAILSEAVVADINDDKRNEIVFGSCDNNVYAITNEGDKIWSYETYFWVVAPPIIDDIDGDGKLEVIVGSYDHNLYILDSKGYYSLDFVPGLGGVVHQSGNYSEVMTREPGAIQAEKIWQYQTNGFIVGCALDEKMKDIIINVKDGVVEDLVHVN